MSLLIINMLTEDDNSAVEAIKKLTEKNDVVKVVNAAEMNIMHCTGCRACMFQTPGVCCLNDDYNELFKLFFKYEDIVVISGTSLNCLDYKTMRVFERRFPFAVILSDYRDGAVRHILRYKKKTKIGILYKVSADQSILEDWLNLYANFVDDMPLGCFRIDCVEELCRCLLQ